MSRNGGRKYQTPRTNQIQRIIKREILASELTVASQSLLVIRLTIPKPIQPILHGVRALVVEVLPARVHKSSDAMER